MLETLLGHEREKLPENTKNDCSLSRTKHCRVREGYTFGVRTTSKESLYDTRPTYEYRTVVLPMIFYWCALTLLTLLGPRYSDQIYK